MENVYFLWIGVTSRPFMLVRGCLEMPPAKVTTEASRTTPAVHGLSRWEDLGRQLPELSGHTTAITYYHVYTLVGLILRFDVEGIQFSC
jgi:hypothetical protein